MKNTQIMLVLVSICCLVGCAGTPGPPPQLEPDLPGNIHLVSVFPDEQAVTDQPAFRPSRRALPLLGVVVPDSINPLHAPLPTNRSEQFVFHQFYDTLTRIMLDGTVQPALAVSWRSFDRNRRWELTLDPAAEFWDGTPVTAQSVVASWLATEFRTTATPSAPNPLRWIHPNSSQVRAQGSRVLVISLAEPVPDLPALLAHPALAVRGLTLPGSVWPLGSGPCRPAPSRLGLDIVPARPGLATWDTCRVRSSRFDARQSDLVLSQDSSAHPGMVGTELPWDRLYILVCPPTNKGATENERRRWTTDLNLRTWAHHIAPGQSRYADTWSFTTDSQRLCPYFSLNIPAWDWPDFNWAGRKAARDIDLILYERSDAVAKNLAAKLADHAGRPLRPAADLAGRGPLTPPRRPSGGLVPQAMGVSPTDFQGALQAGRAGAYILVVPRWDGSGCRQLSNIVGSATWLQEAINDGSISDQPLPAHARALNPLAYSDPTQAEKGALRLERSHVLVPLLFTRAKLWSRPDIAGIKVDYQGNIDLTNVGRR